MYSIPELVGRLWLVDSLASAARVAARFWVECVLTLDERPNIIKRATKADLTKEPSPSGYVDLEAETGFVLGGVVGCLRVFLAGLRRECRDGNLVFATLVKGNPSDHTYLYDSYSIDAIRQWYSPPIERFKDLGRSSLGICGSTTAPIMRES